MAVTATQRLEGRADVEAAVWGLVARSLRQVRSLPPLYRSGVRYRREPARRELWQSARQTYRARAGDCEDLVAWRVAELIASHRDRRARPHVLRVRPGLMHVVVRRGDGRLEDPSRRLGMRGHQPRRRR